MINEFLLEEKDYEFIIKHRKYLQKGFINLLLEIIKECTMNEVYVLYIYYMFDYHTFVTIEIFSSLRAKLNSNSKFMFMEPQQLREDYDKMLLKIAKHDNYRPVSNYTK